MGFSDFLENELLDHVLRNSAYTPAATVYVALHTADPGETGTSEVTGGSYARQSAAWDAASAGSCVNSAIITYTNMPATTVTHYSIWDASSSGNMLFAGALDASRTFTAGDAAQFAAGALTVSLD